MDECAQFVVYIRENPVRRGLVQNAGEYVYSSAAGRVKRDVQSFPGRLRRGFQRPLSI